MIERTHTKDAAGLRLIEALRVHLPQLMGKHGTPGLNIALADKGRLIWEAGFGFADIARETPMTPDSVYHSGSLGKTYTGTAIMILVDRGVIQLSDPIDRHLPFVVKNPLGARDITVHDLMVHKSGLSSDAAASVWTPSRPLVEVLKEEYDREFEPCFGGRKIKRWVNPVGASWCYSNLAIATLGLIVETANPDGLSFTDFVQRFIMDPLGMTHSQYPRAQHPDYARSDILVLATTGYVRMGQADIPTLPVYFDEFPAGGVLARPADHIRLLLAMMNGGELDGYRLFREAIAATMIAPATALAKTPAERTILRDFDGEQGLIWRLNDVGKPWMSFDHGGGHMFGWRTQGRGWPNYGVAMMVAANQWSLPDDTSEVQEIADFVGNWLRYRAPVDAAEPAGLSPAVLSYARGIFAAAAYRALGIPGAPPPGLLDALIADTRDRGGDWDGAAFRRGFEAVYALPPTPEAVRAFLKSARSEIDTETAFRANAALAGRPEGRIAALLAEDGK